ncbi:hypothetical protein BCR39DRAFT_590559 [Naematelia encephala]|uniref:NmrA-like domain-containing protein n=1 Tax=Naematelia encephala TaxID=71784 RepID=A0A1Y2APF1_9TREE|nr:hypothetical protein BCR39DRAFT_590559 [Naematelia encephala]
MVKTILVTGATGQQGGATVRALVESNKTVKEPFSILALSRNPTSDASIALGKLENVEVVKGDLNEPDSIDQLFEAHGPIYGVFSVQSTFVPGEETAQGNALADLAAKHKVQHFVYTSTDYSGLAPHPVPHYEAKRLIEEHIHGLDLEWTIIRPGGFMSTFHWPPLLAAITTMLRKDRRFPVIDVGDIGRAVATIFSDKESFVGKTIHLDGDEPTPSDVVEIFKELTGRDISAKEPPDLGFPPMEKALKTINEHAYIGTPEETKKYFPWVKDLRTFVSENFPKEA